MTGTSYILTLAALLLCARAIFAAPAIGNVSLAGSEIPLYGKAEITFTVVTVAANPYWPYDPNPPGGVPAGTGVTVKAEFTPDDWVTIYTVPAFYYQEFLDDVRGPDPIGCREWFYPTGNHYWKVRFAPFSIGTWKYRILAQDADGSAWSDVGFFTVGPSPLKGPVRASPRDSRYFEHADGSYFPALGYNMNWNRIHWRNPVLDNETNFNIMQANGIQLIRIWLPQWAIFGQSWSPWEPVNGETVDFNNYVPGSELSYKLVYPPTSEAAAFMFQAQHYPRPPVKRNTTYRLRVLAKTVGVIGPRIAGQPYGLVAKTGEWLVPDSTEPGVGVSVTQHLNGTSDGFQVISGTWDSGANDFFPATFVTLENVVSGTAYVDSVGLEEDLGNGRYGPNVMRKPWMAYHQYFDQRNSYAFDKMLTLAEQYGICLKVVLGEKGDYILTRFKYDGTVSNTRDDNYFYGDFRNTTKTRWLLRAWWRYAQARWGYSSSIHTWELLNEGDPFNGRHYALADEFGKYVRAQANPHITTTSFWHSFPKAEFWGNPEYANLDMADVHSSARMGDEEYNDTALLHKRADESYGANTAGGVGKPTIRGETGLLQAEGWDPSPEVWRDTRGIWLHNFLWAQLSPGGLIESPWYEYSHIYNSVEAKFDHRPEFGKFYRFIADIPLNNGYYVDAGAVVSNSEIRAWGQKDLVNKRAHLWISNRNHTWKNVVDGASIPPRSGTVTLSGFSPGASSRVDRWDTYSEALISSGLIKTDENGNILLPVDCLISDYAVKIMEEPEPSPPMLPVIISPTTATITPKESVQFQANQPVTWVSSFGGISEDGLYQAPSANKEITVIILATSKADRQTYATATIWIKRRQDRR